MTSTGLSPIEFFMMAGNVGKAVILILLAASIWCWVLIIEGIIGVIRLKKALRHWQHDEPAPLLLTVAEAAQMASAEHVATESIAEFRARAIDAMNRKARRVVVSLEGSLADLAVIASVAPFVGLFGTVWGIMSSFTAIAAAKDTSLAVVAPGIAEALATTAIGLAAAIPASIGYTRIGSAIGRASQELGSLIEEKALTLRARDSH